MQPIPNPTDAPDDLCTLTYLDYDRPAGLNEAHFVVYLNLTILILSKASNQDLQWRVQQSGCHLLNEIRVERHDLEVSTDHLVGSWLG